MLIKLTGLLFAAYSAFYVFVVIRDTKIYNTYEKVICALVVLLFAVLAGFAFTSEAKNMKFLTIRRVVMLVDLVTVFVIKLFVAGRVFATLDITKLETIFYVGAYLFTQLALLIILLYYALIRKSLPVFPKASVILLITSAAFLLISLVFEALLFFIYNVGLEGNAIRTLVSRPILYFGFIGLSLSFLYPPQVKDPMVFITPDDSEIVTPEDARYIPPEDGEEIHPDDSDYVIPDDGEYIPPEGQPIMPLEGTDFIKPDDGEYVPPEGSKKVIDSDSDYFTPDRKTYI